MASDGYKVCIIQQIELKEAEHRRRIVPLVALLLLCVACVAHSCRR